MRSKGKTFNDINITPLTDIFLVLLIIMMVASPMVEYKGLSLAVLTAGEDTTSDEKPKTLLVEINALGDFTVGDKPVDKGSLAEVLQTQSPACPDGVVVEIDAAATHEALTEAIAAAEKAGVTKLAVMRKAESTKEVLPPSATSSKSVKPPKAGKSK